MNTLGGLGSRVAETLGCQDTRLNDAGSDEVDSKEEPAYTLDVPPQG